jgi:hypothetical protein
MTKAEATYWKEYIERVITSRLSTLTNVEIDAAQIRTFADRHMELITGQQLLPQTIFRIFVEEFAPISEWQEQLRELMEEFNGPYMALTDSEMDAIFGITPAVVTIAVIEVGSRFVGGDSVFADRSAADDTVDGTTVMYCFKYQSMKFYVHDENLSIGDNVYAWDDENESYYVYSTILSMVDSEGHEITE